MTAPAPLPAMLTVAEAADLLHMSRTGIRNLCRSGGLPAVQVGPGRQWRIRTALLLAGAA